MKRITAWMVALGVLSMTARIQAWDDVGAVMFRNSFNSSVIDGRTGLPVEPERVVAGLYANTNLDAGLYDPFTLVTTVPVSPVHDPRLWGIYSGGAVPIPGTVPGQPVLLQVRVWPVGFESYEDALSSGAEPVGLSRRYGPLILGGSIIPLPSLSAEVWSYLMLRYLYGNNMPVAEGIVLAGFQNRTLSGQLTGSDYDGDTLTFALVSDPALGTVTVEPDGGITYHPFFNVTGTDYFTFKVNDGELDSLPGHITVIIRSWNEPGQIVFNNAATNLVMDSRTGLPVEPGVAVAGLYVSTNLDALPDPAVPVDAFELVALAPVGLGSEESFWGLFDGGTLEITSAQAGQPVLLQVRVWAAEFATYAEAFNHAEAFVAVSEVLGPISLGGTDLPVPVLAELETLGPLTLTLVPGNRAPEAENATFEVTQLTTFSGQLSGSDPEGGILTYSLVNRPTLGTFELAANGGFTYSPHSWGTAIDSFTFRVNDGYVDSAVATASIYINIPTPQGTVNFRNSSASRILDSTTGQPVASHMAMAGLYLSTNLNALPNPSVPNDGFALMATAPVSIQATPAFWGLFNGGVVEIPGTVPGQLVLCQVRAWSASFASYEEALQHDDAMLAASALIGPLTLGGGYLSSPLLDDAGLTEMTLTRVFENNPPAAIDGAFLTFDDQPFFGQLEGRDYDGDTLVFSLVSPPALGTVTLETNGQFRYDPILDSQGLDAFTFRVNDGLEDSSPATVAITVISHQAQGTVLFNNSSSGKIRDGRTGQPVARDVAVAGLYASTNLNAVPHPGLPEDAFVLVATTPVSPETNEVWWGLFDGGIVEIPGVRPGQPALLQVRVWEAGQASYEEALQQEEPLVTVSDLIGPFILGGGGLPSPELGQSTNLTGMTLRFLRGAHPPVALDSALSVRANTTGGGQLTGSDPDGDLLAFSLVSPPTLGTVTLEPNGYFSYRFTGYSTGTDVFTFQVSDGTFSSEPARVSILILPSMSGGQVVFRNGPATPVIDSRTGYPVEPGVAVAGLYCTPDLNAVPDLSLPKDAFGLIATAVVTPTPSFAGIYSGGTVTLGFPEGTLVLLQVRVWPAAFVSYEDALLHGATFVGASSVLTIGAGGGSLPVPNIVTAIDGIILGPPVVNHAPVALIQLSPQLNLFPESTNWYVLAPNNTNAAVLLDGSPSSDQDMDPLTCAWFIGPDLWPLALGEVAAVDLEVGQHTIVLLVDDGTGTGTAQATLEILTPAAAVDELIAQVEASPLESNRKKPLTASLQAACDAFDRNQFRAGLNQLDAFLRKIRSQVLPQDPAWGERVINLTQDIIRAAE